MTAPTPDQIARNFDGTTDQTPIRNIWTAEDELNRLPPGSAVAVMIVGTVAIVAIVIAVYGATVLFSSAMDKANHDTAGMICPAPC
jgi:hypothetical protein